MTGGIEFQIEPVFMVSWLRILVKGPKVAAPVMRVGRIAEPYIASRRQTVAPDGCLLHPVAVEVEEQGV